MSDESGCCPTPIKDLHLPDQSGNVGPQTPNIERQFAAIEKRYGKLDTSPDSMKPTPFTRGIPPS